MYIYITASIQDLFCIYCISTACIRGVSTAAEVGEEKGLFKDKWIKI